MTNEEAIAYLKDPIGKREQHDEAIALAIKALEATEDDLIRRQDAICVAYDCEDEFGKDVIFRFIDHINQIPSAQPTLYGYSVEHLILIARALQKENLSPERVADALMDIGRIVAMVKGELEKTLRKAEEQCWI